MGGPDWVIFGGGPPPSAIAGIVLAPISSTPNRVSSKILFFMLFSFDLCFSSLKAKSGEGEGPLAQKDSLPGRIRAANRYFVSVGISVLGGIGGGPPGNANGLNRSWIRARPQRAPKPAAATFPFPGAR